VLISVGQDIGFYDGELGLDAASYKTLQAEGIERKKALEAEAAARKAETTAAKPGEAAAVTAKSTDKEQMKCACGGPHPLKIVGSEVKPIQSYTGELKSPLMMVPKVYAALENVPFSEIRRWAREAAEYHEVPYEIVAVILQQENGQNATNLQKIGQFLERSVTTIIAQGNEEIVPIFSWIGKIFPKVMRAPNGSTGIMNMQRKTLKDTISYTKEKYARPLVPASKSKIDTGYAGRDWEADMYYLAAHVRQLMDRVVMGGGKSCVKGEITLSQVGKTFAAYNGLGKDADNYGNDAMTKLMGAYKGESTLYFYER
jgi:hypothetical protein